RLLGEYDLRERTYWLALPLPHTSGWSSTAQVVASAGTLVARSFGLTPPLPRPAEVRRRIDPAERAVRGVPGLVPAPAAEVLWIHRRAPRRGTAAEPSLASARRSGPAGATVRGDRLRNRGLAALSEVHLDEGGRAAGAAWANPFHHRYLRVTTPDGGTSYQ